MTFASTEHRDAAGNGKSRLLARHGAAVIIGALIMAWPALYNRYPLLYPDSMTYLGDGRTVARALFLHKFSDYYGMRSFIYSLGILPWHWNVTAWPIVIFQSLITAYVLWLVVRSLLARLIVSYYLALVTLLSLLTSFGWFASLVMPDFLGPVLYLCIYLLVFARESLSRVERVSVFLISWWAITSHATHLMLAVGLLVLLALLTLLRPRPTRQWRGLAEVAMAILLAAAAQLALHAYLYGTPSLNGERPPFLMARVIADGPGRWYLAQHCGQVNFILCDHLQDLADNPDDFLWGENSIWQNADEETEKRIRREEMPFVLATLRAYPREQLLKSAANFWQQLHTFGLELFDGNDWMLAEFSGVMPRERDRYLRSRQAQNSLPLEFFTTVQYWTVYTSLAVIIGFVPYLWRLRPARLVGLSVVIVPAVIANALVTGALSMVEDRLQSRVVWLIPFLAGVLLLDLFCRWRHPVARGRPGWIALRYT